MAKFLEDSYLEWLKGEGVPVIEDFGVDLLQVETQPWARMEARGAFVHVKGRGDFLSVYVCDLPPGGATAPQSRLCEEVFYVLDGRGSTGIETPEGRHSFEWGTGSLFAIPLNARFRLFNSSGLTSARLAAVTSLPLALNAFHDQRFVFENLWAFEDRLGEARYYRGEGEFIPIRPGRHMWETVFVPDLRGFKLYEWKERGAGGTSMQIILADGTMHAHTSEMPVGTYKKAHRHGPDFHIFPVTGQGYSLLWYEGDPEMTRIDWRHGCVYAPPDRMFHQHFNISPAPSRYLAVGFGSLRYPFTSQKLAGYLGNDKGQKEGGNQIEYEDEDQRIHRIFKAQLAKNGVECRMHLSAASHTPA